MPNNNPTGINQYTKGGRVSKSKRSTKFYHGSDKVLKRVEPRFSTSSKTAFATTSIKTAVAFAKAKSEMSGKPPRLMQVSIGKPGQSMLIKQSNGKRLVLSSKAMPVIRSIRLFKRKSK